MDLEFPFPKLSFPVSHLLLSQFSNSGGFLFEYGLGVVGSPSRGILLVSISVFGLDLDERWQRFGWGGVFTNLCLVSERLSMARAYDSPKEGALDGVSIPIVSLGQSSGKSTSSSLQAKVSLQEGETHDGGSMLTLSYGYCTASLSFTHGQLGSNSSDTTYCRRYLGPSVDSCYQRVIHRFPTWLAQPSSWEEYSQRGRSDFSLSWWYGQDILAFWSDLFYGVRNFGKYR
ncbi:hypothetical protein V6N13_108189 [Hibiscus sabdariffa]